MARRRTTKCVRESSMKWTNYQLYRLLWLVFDLNAQTTKLFHVKEEEKEKVVLLIFNQRMK